MCQYGRHVRHRSRPKNHHDNIVIHYKITFWNLDMAHTDSNSWLTPRTCLASLETCSLLLASLPNSSLTRSSSVVYVGGAIWLYPNAVTKS